MTSWRAFEEQAPVLAAAVRARFAAGPTAKHHVVATLRADGSPRVSGTEVGFAHGELFLGSMPGARKARDLQRDPRCAVHAHPGDSSMDGGDAKLAGRAVEVVEEGTKTAFLAAFAEHTGVTPPTPFVLFRVDVTELSFLRPEDDHLVIDWWRAGSGVHRVERS
jgi:hypothetical protein